LEVIEAAAAMVETVNSNMAEALRIVSVEPATMHASSRSSPSVARPVHTAALAAELQIPEVIVPPTPGAFSALGLVASDLKRDYPRTLYADLATLDPARVCERLSEM
jgi:N-methylhydantoinase A